MVQEKENWVETLFRWLGLIGGGWMTIELIKLLSKVIYTCPHCHNEIQYKIGKCPHCKVKLIWKI